MKTKTSILTALVALASGTGAMAQVYSQNVVGYVNVEIPAGFSMIANPLDTENNTVGSLLNVPDGTSIYKFDSGTGQFVANNYFFGWNDANMTLNPGEGVFIYNQGSAFTLTFVGEVMTGALSNPIPAGFSMRASQVPQAGQLDSDLGFPAADGDSVYLFDSATQQYVAHNYFFGWNQVPNLKVGEAFFVNKVGATSWNRTFNVN